MTNPWLVRMGQSFSRKPQNPSPKPTHTRTPKPVESKFDQDFDRFMNGLENFEPFDDLEEWSDNVELFMDTMAKPNECADALWVLAKLKKRKSQGSRTIKRVSL